MEGGGSGSRHMCHRGLANGVANPLNSQLSNMQGAPMTIAGRVGDCDMIKVGNRPTPTRLALCLSMDHDDPNVLDTSQRGRRERESERVIHQYYIVMYCIRVVKGPGVTHSGCEDRRQTQLTTYLHYSCVLSLSLSFFLSLFLSLSRSFSRSLVLPIFSLSLQ